MTIIVLKAENLWPIMLTYWKYTLFKQGTPKTLPWEKHEITNWTRKMLQRASIEDIEGNFRRHWLLYDLLECYFKMRDIKYLGPKKSFQWMAENDPETYAAFNTALKSKSTLKNIEKLVDKVTFTQKN